MYQYFPKLCPPVCGLEINLRRIRTSPRITVHTLASVEAVTFRETPAEVVKPMEAKANVP